MRPPKESVGLYSHQKVGDERRRRVRLDPGVYDRSSKGQVVLHAPVEVDEIETLVVTATYALPFWEHTRYDWNTAQAVPPPEPPPPSMLSRVVWWLLGLIGVKRRPALPPARVVDDKNRR